MQRAALRLAICIAARNGAFLWLLSAQPHPQAPRMCARLFLLHGSRGTSQFKRSRGHHRPGQIQRPSAPRPVVHRVPQCRQKPPPAALVPLLHCAQRTGQPVAPTRSQRTGPCYVLTAPPLPVCAPWREKTASHPSAVLAVSCWLGGGLLSTHDPAHRWHMGPYPCATSYWQPKAPPSANRASTKVPTCLLVNGRVSVDN